QRIVGGGEVVAAAVPRTDALARHVVQHPARAGFHAELMDAAAQHVVVVAHDDAAERVAGLLDGVTHGALVAFDIQLDASREAVRGAVEVVARADDAIARHGQEGAAEHIEVRRGGRVGVGGGALGGVLLVPAYACYALCIPSPPRLGRIGGQRLEVLGDIA